MNWWPFRKRTIRFGERDWTVDELRDLFAPSTAASHLSRHGAEQRRDKIVTKAKAIAERMNRPDLVERLTR